MDFENNPANIVYSTLDNMRLVDMHYMKEGTTKSRL